MHWLAVRFCQIHVPPVLQRLIETADHILKGDRFVSMTYDAFAKNILDHFLYALPDELRPATDYLVNDPDIIDAETIRISNGGYNDFLDAINVFTPRCFP